MENNVKKIHTESKTTVKLNAGYRPFSCGFFCTRVIKSDVIDPSLQPKQGEQNDATTQPASPSLCD